jgi:hypothetical protein
MYMADIFGNIRLSRASKEYTWVNANLDCWDSEPCYREDSHRSLHAVKVEGEIAWEIYRSFMQNSKQERIEH